MAQTNAQWLAAQALKRNKTLLRESVEDLMEAVAIILEHSGDFDPKQVHEHFMTQVQEAENRLLKR